VPNNLRQTGTLKAPIIEITPANHRGSLFKVTAVF